MKVNKSSVTGALQALSNNDLINYAPYDVITLTPKGESSARQILKRHEVLKEFFHKILGLNEDEAETSACRMEHVLSAPALKRLVYLIGFLEQEPESGTNCLEKFRAYCENKGTKERSKTKGNRSGCRRRQ
jgi:DtxR family Mn-dependent transcriptional regulator